MNWLVAGAVVPGLLVSWAVACVMCRVAPAIGLVDRPGLRKVHVQTKPYGGGVAIWAGIVLPLAAGQLALWAWQAASHGGSEARLDVSQFGERAQRLADWVEPHLPGLVSQAPNVWFLLAGGTVLMLLGLADDFRKLDWRFRLSIEALVASAVVFGRGWELTLFVDLPIVTGVVSVLWIVWLVNSFNMLDNMDGLSGGVAAIAAAILAIVMLLTPESDSQSSQLFVAGFLFLMVGALGGFLLLNGPPARIFMGDSGAYFIGFCLAVTTILATFSGGGLPRHAILAPLCVLAVPLYDTVSVVCIRWREGRSPFEGDTSHFSHRLVALGLTQRQAVLTIYLTTAACGLGALLLHEVSPGGALVVLLMIGCLLSVIAILEITALRKMR